MPGLLYVPVWEHTVVEQGGTAPGWAVERLPPPNGDTEGMAEAGRGNGSVLTLALEVVHL